MLYSIPLSPRLMHIPDGFLSTAVSILFLVLSALILGTALRRTGRTLGERQVPLMGVVAAAIFAGQMLNFAVAGGTSGHLLGAALAAIVLGPWPAVLVMTSVVGVQALLFQDGGLLALGANVFNMAVIGVFVSYAVFTLARRLIQDPRNGMAAAGFAAGWASVFVAALAVALQLAVSGTSPANIAVPAMAAVHAVIGLGDALITASALAFLQHTRPDLLERGATGSAANRGVWVGGAVLVVALLLLSPLASTHPDGLQWVAEQQGFLPLARAAGFRILPGAALPGQSTGTPAAAVAGLVGVIAVFGMAAALARAAKRSTPRRN